MIKITDRDKKVLAAGGVFVLLFLILQFALFPLLEKRERLQQSIANREKDLTEMQELQAQYQQLDSKADVLLDQLVGRQKNFSLFSYMEQMAAKSEVKKNIAYMKPSETADEGPFIEILVEMKLQAISLEQLVNYLELIESPENVIALKRISIQENKKEAATLDVIMQVVTLNHNPEANES